MDTELKDIPEKLLASIFQSIHAIYGVDLSVQEKKAKEGKKIIHKFEKMKPGTTYTMCLGMFIIAQYLARFKEKKQKFNDFCNVLGKKISEHLTETKPKDLEFLDRVSYTGPYLTFYCKIDYLANKLLPNIISGDYFKMEKKKERIMVEYSQPNTHKVFHIGHMRNVALGWSIVLLNRFLGYDVVAANYIGDVGSHIAKCLWYYQRFENPDGKKIEDCIPKDMTRVEWLGMMYSNSVTELDPETFTKFPYPGYSTAKVLEIEDHPNESKWKKVKVFDGKKECTIVCGGKNYNVGDVVGFVPVGAKIGGKECTEVDKKGIVSQGVILGKREVGLKSKDKNDIFVLPEGTGVGISLMEYGRIKGKMDEGLKIEEEIKKREAEWKNVLLKIEEKDKKTIELWEKTREWCLEDFKKIYKWIDCEFDHYFFESDVEESSKAYAQEAYKKGLFVESDGAIGMDLSKYKLGFAMVLTSAGNGLYLTKDLELAKLKFEKFKIDKSIYVVDSGQSFHFQQAFKTLELLGFEQAKKSKHVAYGIVTLPGGKMSSRKGSVIKFTDLKNKITEAIKKEYFNMESEALTEKKKKMLESWSEEEKEKAIRKIAIGTIKYGMLNQDNNKVIVFKMKDWVGKKGNTGPYILYANTRTKSILRKNKLSPEDLKGEVNYALCPEGCRKVLTKIFQFIDVVKQAAESSKPSYLTNYLFNLCQDFSSMYEMDECSVMKSKDPQKKRVLLDVYHSINIILKKGLELLGIDELEHM